VIKGNCGKGGPSGEDKIRDNALNNVGPDSLEPSDKRVNHSNHSSEEEDEFYAPSRHAINCRWKQIQNGFSP